MFRKIKKYREQHALKKFESEATAQDNKRKRVRLVAIILTAFFMSIAVYVICFAFRSPVVPQVFSNKVAQVHLISPFEFSFISEYQTEARRNLAAERIPPLYKVDNEAIAEIGNTLKSVFTLIDEKRAEFESLPESEEESAQFFEKLSAEIRNVSRLSVNPEDLKLLMKETSEKSSKSIFNHAFFALKTILQQGVYEDNDTVFSQINKNDDVRADISGGITKISTEHAISESVAETELLEKIRNIGISENLARAFYRIFEQKLNPNIEFDAEQTKALRDEARMKVQPVTVRVREGETILDASTMPTQIMQEKLKAYKNEVSKRKELSGYTKAYMYTEYLVCLLLVCAATLFIVISRSQKNKRPRTSIIFCALLLFNLFIERLIIHIANTEYFDTNTTLLQLFTYGTPIMLGPIIQVLLFGSYTGFLMAILVAALTTMMLGESVVLFILFLTAALVAIYFCDGAISRKRVIMGGIIYGSFLAIFSLAIGFTSDTPISILWRQAVSPLIVGTLTGVFATVILPLVERIFGTYSNIALLEYTDSNNPLLRKLQIEAPGSYNHCVMVSILAEQAASKVKANPMVCRVGALYHDIGKIVKPEYFSENQSTGINPHDEQNPAMSARIIKNHVYEGEAFAHIQKLPRQIIDAIKQHHGTTKIAYFYNKAKNIASENNEPEVDESTYRYEGVKPKTVENAIIMLADSCEAAARSLNKPTRHGITTLVDNIVKSKIDDGQLDDCPITVKQISKIKESFVFTMMNMMHSRVAYNNEKK